MRPSRIKKSILVLVSYLLLVQQTMGFPTGTTQVVMHPLAGVRTTNLKNITTVIQNGIAAGHYPGAVVLVGHHGKIIYQGVFGNRRLLPHAAPMQLDTIFDLASLTKVVATTPAIMQLVEQGKIDLDAPVAKYWAAFAKHQKDTITIRELLTHTSGLPAEIAATAANKTQVLQQIEKLTPSHPPGKVFTYSDINFVVLAYLVERITHESFDHYVAAHIFKPLNMSHTTFLPKKTWQDKIAPTEIINGKLRWGTVHDPLAATMQGVSGNAGLFSTASDLAYYAQWLLDAKAKQPILSPLTILKMTSAETSAEVGAIRGFGWDIDSPMSNRGVLFPVNSYGHTGWTGTSIWIDPTTKTWVIVLTNRTHPHAQVTNALIEDRRLIATIVAASLMDVTALNLKNTSKHELSRAYSA